MIRSSGEDIWVTWSPDAPKSWRFIWTDKPMLIISARWDDGVSSSYADQFGGLPRTPGFVVIVEYEADSTSYFDPPRSLLFNKRKLQMEVHSIWLELAMQVE